MAVAFTRDRRGATWKVEAFQSWRRPPTPSFPPPIRQNVHPHLVMAWDCGAGQLYVQGVLGRAGRGIGLQLAQPPWPGDVELCRPLAALPSTLGVCLRHARATADARRDPLQGVVRVARSRAGK